MPQSKDLIITRIFDVPVKLVWHAWTNPEFLMNWWGPKTFTSPLCEIDLRIGGKYLFCMRSPDGKDYWTTGEYREIVPLERIVFTDCFSDENGNVVPSTYYGMEGDFPLELTVTVTFEDLGERTRMTMRHVEIPAGDHRAGAQEGWNGSFDKLAESLMMQ